MNLEERVEANKKKFLEQFALSRGNISIACTNSGIVRSTYYEWINGDSAFAQSVSDALETNKDIAETIIQKAIEGFTYTEEVTEFDDKGKVLRTKKIKKHQSPDGKLALQFLQAKAQERGYGKTLDITSGGKPIQTAPFVLVVKEDEDGIDSSE